MAVDYVLQPVESWGRIIRAPELIARPSHADELQVLLETRSEAGPILGIGLNRSYGDSGLNPGGRAISLRRLDRFIAFDAERGVLRAEGGVSLDEILRLIVARGWFLPTTPGTRYVTLGGAIANDVHGKNHHKAGSFGRHVRRIGLLRSDAGMLDLSPTDHPDLFNATLGGLGLTGLVVWAEIALVPIASAFLDQQARPFLKPQRVLRPKR